MHYSLHDSLSGVGIVAVALIAKSGNTSIKSAAAQGWYVKAEEAEQYPIRLAFIREPFDRLYSAYSFFSGLYWNGEKYDKHGTVESAARSYYHFINHALEHRDEHWKNQGEILLSGEVKPTHLIKFDYINDLWPNIFPSELRKCNSSVRLPVCKEYRKAELQDFYKTDLELYNSALDYETAKRLLSNG